jgi:amino acid adenylation domain-containing protein
MSVVPLLSRLKEMEIVIRLVGNQLKIHAPKGKLTPDLLAQLKGHKEAIIRFLRKMQRSNEYTAIEPAEQKEYYSLSSAQKRLYFIQQMVPETTAYNIPMSISPDNNRISEKIESIFMQLIARHESLRTTFHLVDGEPVQRIHEKVEFKVKVEGEIPSTEVLYERFVQPFDLSQAPLLRVELIKTGGGKSVFLIDMHHIITDGTSQEILTRELMELYTGEELEPLRLQYKDYSEWQNNDTRKAAVRRQEEYWLKTFAEESPVLDLPLDYQRPLIQSFIGSKVDFWLEVYQVEGLRAITKKFDVTLFMLFLSIFNVFLSKLSGHEDIVIGTPIAARRHVHLNNIIGMFVNTLPLRNNPRGEKTFACFLHEVKKNTIEAYENQEYPFEDIVDNLDVNRDTSRNPVFDVVFNLLNHAENKSEIPEMEPRQPYHHQAGTSKFDLQLTAVEVGKGHFFTLDYCRKLFKPQTIERFIGYFKKLVHLVTEDPEVLLSGMEIIAPEEKRLILYDFNDTAADYPKDKLIQQLFAEQVKKKPDGAAVAGKGHGCKDVWMHGNISITYRELNRKADQLAHLLNEIGVLADEIVAILMEQSIEMIIGIIGILKAGGAYLPIDPYSPQERIDYMLKDSKAKVLVITNTLAGEVEKLRRWEFEKVFLEEVLETKESSSQPINLSTFQLLNSSNLSYIIYTSGTTGKPKGSMIDHRNVVRLLVNDRFPFDFGPLDVWTMFHSYCFDFSVWEMWGALVYGGRLIIVPPMTSRDPSEFLKLLKKEGVTVLNQTPGAFYHLSNEALTDASQLLSLRYVIFGGEALAPAKLNKWKERYPLIRLVNMYGITETTVHVTFKEISNREILLNKSNIGKPIPTLTIYIMDKDLKLQPPGVAGELCVGGDGVGRGYLNQPELTRDKFAGNIYKPGERLYKSGDLAKFFASASDEIEIEYLGRIDQQVKIRGYRIELGEIENQLLIHEQVKEVVVIWGEGDSDISDNYLCAYTVLHSPGSVTAVQLRDYLSHRVPGFMIPAYFVQLEKLPLTPNGKLDKSALPLPHPDTSGEYTAPQDQIEEKMVEIWQEVLGLENIPISTHADFFELGGHSLNAIRVVNAIHKTFNVKISIQIIFQSPTIVELAVLIRENEITPFIEITPVPTQEYYELSYAQKRLWVLQKRDPNSQAFNMPERVTFNETVDKRIIREVLAKLIARHDSLRTYFTEVDGKIVQKIASAGNTDITLEVIDLSHLAEVKQRSHRYRLLAEESLVPFYLGTPPLLRAKLVKCKRDEYDLIFNMHHLVSDGWSLEILKTEFSLLYRSLAEGYEYELESVEIQYKDYTYWHNRLLEDEERVRGPLEFWKKQLAGSIPLLNLPYDFSLNELSGKKSSAYRTVVDSDITEKLRNLGRQYNASLFMVLLASINVLLSQLRGQDDILICMPGAARQHEDLKNTVGLFVNTLILRTRIDKEETFTVFLKHIQTNALKILEYQSYPLELICEQLKIKYPQLSFFFNMVNTINPNLPVLANTEAYHLETVQDTKFDIALYLTEYNNGINLVCCYYSQLFMPETIEKMMQMYLQLLRSVAEAPDKKLKEYKGPAKKRKLKRNK